ncbi:hypothetical protein [Paraburkholderia sp. WC7.3g]|uniref:hypothetical protein n=1 Tax=Paraburkholderia sp. WC7.3g TaxID=2991070 RepID=UPI003D1CA756
MSTKEDYLVRIFLGDLEKAMSSRAVDERRIFTIFHNYARQTYYSSSQIWKRDDAGPVVPPRLLAYDSINGPSRDVNYIRPNKTDDYKKIFKWAALYLDAATIVSEDVASRSREAIEGDLISTARLNLSLKEDVIASGIAILPDQLEVIWPHMVNQNLDELRKEVLSSRSILGRNAPSRASFDMHSTKLPRYEDSVILAPIILPYFDNVSVETIRIIKKMETDAFDRFKCALQKNLIKIGKNESESAIKEIISEIQEDAIKLKIETIKLNRLKTLQYASYCTLGVSIAATIAPELTQLHFLSGMLGTASVFTAMQSLASARNALDTMRQSAYYIPFIVKR